ncbi:MAG: hypothetical protein A3F67_05115 [Verrucomicrobia bacterium RIFCSPHIGHO2_12_FULL_41_10]|nr:MAG: hypothetical protein A3F67_05115 [Verrucomicrobia bacterium RIFCSPHIGHO2_12_FULL_41_10]
MKSCYRKIAHRIESEIETLNTELTILNTSKGSLQENERKICKFMGIHYALYWILFILCERKREYEPPPVQSVLYEETKAP